MNQVEANGRLSQLAFRTRALWHAVVKTRSISTQLFDQEFLLAACSVQPVAPAAFQWQQTFYNLLRRYPTDGAESC